MKFLVVAFDRYDTKRSGYLVVEADSHLEAAFIFYEIEDSPEDQKHVEASFSQVDDVFACEPGEESDLLIYKI